MNANNEKTIGQSNWIIELGGAISGMSLHWLIAIVLAWSLTVCLAANFLLVGPDHSPVGDELDYNGYAVSLVENHQFIARPGNPYWPQDLARRPPAYPFLMAAVYSVTGTENFIAVRMVQVILVTLLALVVFLLGRRFLGTGAGLLAGLMTGTYPYLVNLSTEMRPEPLYFLAVYTSLGLFAAFLITRRPLFAILCGACWAVTALTRSDWMLAVPMFLVLGLWKLRISRETIARLSLIALVVAAIILPWTARNYLAFGKLVPISTNMGTTIAGTNNPLIAADADMRGQWVPPEAMEQMIPNLMSLSEAERDSVQTAYALDYIKKNPAEFAGMGLSRLLYHWHLYLPLTNQGPIELFGLAVYFGIALLAIAGVVLLLKRRIGGDFLALGLVLFVFSTVVAFGIRGGTRYRLMIDPYLILLAAYTIVSLANAALDRRKVAISR